MTEGELGILRKLAAARKVHGQDAKIQLLTEYRELVESLSVMGRVNVLSEKRGLMILSITSQGLADLERASR